MFVDVLSARVRVFGWKEYAGVRFEAEKFLPAAAPGRRLFSFFFLSLLRVSFFTFLGRAWENKKEVITQLTA